MGFPQGELQPLDDVVISYASRVRWMYILRLAVGLGLCDLNTWQRVHRQLTTSQTKVDRYLLFENLEGIHALLHSTNGHYSQREITVGVFSRSTEAKGEVTMLVERGHARLAKINVLLRTLWEERSGVGKISHQDRSDALTGITGVMIGECELHPKLSVKIFSVLGQDIIRRTSAYAVGVSEGLAVDVANLRISPRGGMDPVSQWAAGTVIKLAAALAIGDATCKRKGNLPVDAPQRAAALKSQLLSEIGAYKGKDIQAEQVNATRLICLAQDLFAEVPPDQTYHEPGTTHFELMIDLLGGATPG